MDPKRIAEIRAALPTAKGVDLVDMHNELVQELGHGKEVARFSDSAVARKRIQKLLDAAPAPVKSSSRSEAIAASWKDRDVAERRAARHHVIVGCIEYRSVKQAFEALNLPLGKHIAFRARLKAAGTLDEFGFTWTIKEF